jgi:hypothetical protein
MTMEPNKDNPEKSGAERRTAPRAIFPCRIMISSPVRLLVSHTENISEGGIRVMLEERLSPFTMVGIELYFDKNKPIKCKGKIAWIKEITNPVDRAANMFDTGIKFIDVGEFDKAYLKKLVSSFGPKDLEK